MTGVDPPLDPAKTVAASTGKVGELFVGRTGGRDCWAAGQLPFPRKCRRPECLSGQNPSACLRKGKHPPGWPMDIVRALRNLGGVNTALHLCGKYARMAAGETHAPHSLNLLCNGFGRVQVNLHGEATNPERVQVRAARVRHGAQKVETGSVILQHRGPWSEIPMDHPRIEYLFDLSEGRGKEGFEHWPDPPEGKRVGYAGGLGPHNITTALEFAKGHPKARIWFDMERNVRDQDYRLDLDRVREVCRLALGPQLPRFKRPPFTKREPAPAGQTPEPSTDHGLDRAEVFTCPSWHEVQQRCRRIEQQLDESHMERHDPCEDMDGNLTPEACQFCEQGMAGG